MKTIKLEFDQEEIELLCKALDRQLTGLDQIEERIKMISSTKRRLEVHVLHKKLNHLYSKVLTHSKDVDTSSDHY